LLTDVTVSAPAKAPLALFVTVTGCALLAEPASCGGKPKLVGKEIAACVPVPESATVDGWAPGIFTVADRAPTVAGWKARVISHFALGPRLVHVFPATAKSLCVVGENDSAPIPADVLPAFDMVTLRVSCVPLFTLCDPKPRLLGDASRSGVGAPVPLRETCCELPGALSLKVRLALLVPAACGANRTATVQLVPITTVPPPAGQLPPAIEKSAAFVPVTATLITLSAALPLFVSVTLSGALDVAMIWLPNPRETGAIVATGALAIPVPVNGTSCLELVTLPESSVKSSSA
jgi:hypothetical protein